MKILSPHCILMDTVPADNIDRLKKDLWPQFFLANSMMEIERKSQLKHADDTKKSPISELRLLEDQVIKAYSAMPSKGALDITRSRFNAIMNCWNVDTHTDKHVGWWTWLTYLEENKPGKFYMGQEDAKPENASLVLPVKFGTSFCFDSCKPHGFHIDIRNGPWVSFVSLIVTKESVLDILESRKSVRYA